MDQLIKNFQHYLREDGKSELTVKNYTSHLQHFFTWFENSKGISFQKLHRENILDYISFLRNIEKARKGKNAGQPLSIKTVNAKISALIKLDAYLQHLGELAGPQVTKKDLIATQPDYLSLSKLTVKDVERFRQLILDADDNKRNYAVITVMAYAGLRISEALNLKVQDVNLTSKELIVRKGKRDKVRVVYLNDKIVTALKGWYRQRTEKGIENDYIFVSKRGNRLDQTVINKLFNKYNGQLETPITPHDLRHFFCSYLIDNEFALHEVQHLAGHSNIHTTMIYANPTKEFMKNKMNRL